MPFPFTGFPYADGGETPEDRSDYRPVPASDVGNKGYTDRGMLGTYQTDAEPFPKPDGVKYFTGYGADEADLVRGFKEPEIRDQPAYNLENYKYRSTEPKLSDLDEGGDAMSDDYDFRRRNRRSRGFLTRPHTPTDR